jgi:hypothetical protein
MLKHIYALAAIAAILPTLAVAAEAPVQMNDKELDTVTAGGIGLALNLGAGVGLNAAGAGLNVGTGVNASAHTKPISAEGAVSSGFGVQVK